MELIVIRHGQAKHNIGGEEKHVFAGRKVDNDLTAEGRITVQKLAQKISDKSEADLIVSSSLRRSKKTAEIIAQKIKVPIISFSELDEFDVGKFAGRTEEEVRKLYPVEAHAFYSGDIEHWSFPGGENYHQLKLRLEKAIQKIKKLPPSHSRIIICGHGGLNRVLFYLCARAQEDLWKNRNYSHDCITRIKI
jgi:probable phosphoglycerate mutase